MPKLVPEQPMDGACPEGTEAYLCPDAFRDLLRGIADHSEDCPKCKDGMIVVRNGGYATFLACSNYGKKGIACNFKMSLRDSYRDLFLTQAQIDELNTKGYLNVGWYHINIRIMRAKEDLPTNQQTGGNTNG